MASEYGKVLYRLKRQRNSATIIFSIAGIIGWVLAALLKLGVVK